MPRPGWHSKQVLQQNPAICTGWRPRRTFPTLSAGSARMSSFCQQEARLCNCHRLRRRAPAVAAVAAAGSARPSSRRWGGDAKRTPHMHTQASHLAVYPGGGHARTRTEAAAHWHCSAQRMAVLRLAPGRGCSCPRVLATCNNYCGRNTWRNPVHRETNQGFCIFRFHLCSFRILNSCFRMTRIS